MSLRGVDVRCNGTYNGSATEVAAIVITVIEGTMDDELINAIKIT